MQNHFFGKPLAKHLPTYHCIPPNTSTDQASKFMPLSVRIWLIEMIELEMATVEIGHTQLIGKFDNKGDSRWWWIFVKEELLFF